MLVDRDAEIGDLQRLFGDNALGKGVAAVKDEGNGTEFMSLFDVESLVRLSDAERRVAILAASGYTNSQISSMLYITVSTVEQHLTRVYRKLGVSGRENLPLEI